MEIDLIVDSILDETGLSYTDVVSERSGILVSLLIKNLISNETINGCAFALGIEEDALESVLRRHLKPLLNKTCKNKWGNFLLELVSLHRCSACKEIKHKDMFGKYAGVCFTCDNIRTKKYCDSNRDSVRLRNRQHYEDNKDVYVAKSIKYKTHRTLATPKWANLDIIRDIYNNAEGAHVDHIIPLQGELVCGLHVENNLQYLTPEENLRKSNKFEILDHV